MGEEWQPKPPTIGDNGMPVYPLDPNTGVPTTPYVKILSDVDAVKNGLAWGEATNAYVRRYMTIGASNKVSDLISSGLQSLRCVSQARAEEDAVASQYGAWDFQMKIAEIAKRRGCGNCNEQTAIALWFLSGYGQVPLDGIEWEGGDHRMALLGRQAGDVYDLSTWGPRAVVVDPWNGVTYPAAEFRQHRGSSERWSHFARKER
ncbi:hypothetical protein LPC08_05930 [Roseomonas sp. OT10]|uniref:hypothetical protein n=1 Tax=Roseomonas cutis TaxID=2897332 RepID=UPI001E580096|nr:hypothetical protein [Roseomonas sp. OT10]UFN50161.1 hypothetical protein LPC08_05930 [Roseomonas sp. OT10]